MYALNSDKEDIDALLLADLFDKSSESGWCSSFDYQKAVESVIEALKRSSSMVDVSTASDRLKVILGGMELPESFTSSIIHQLRQTEAKPKSIFGNHVRNDSFSTNASTDKLTMSPKVNKVKIE